MESSSQKLWHRIFAVLSFLMAFITYSMTVQPTVPFWDCGEFSSASIWQQVPHPPGAPLFLMLGKLFDIIIPFGEPGWRVNMVAVASGAFTVLITYLICVKLINNLREEKAGSLGDMIAVYGSAFIAAAALTFSDTMWFNSVESEVYATSLLFVAIIVWLMMKWNEKADEVGHEKYLLLIAYLMGLSTGVHLLSILTVFSIVLLVYFRKYQFTWKSFFIMGAIAVAIFFIIYPGIVKWIPSFLAGHSPGRNAAREYSISDSVFLQAIAVLTIIAAMWGLWKGVKSKNSIVSLATASFLLMIVGYTTYTQILVRSNANPPMNENEPKNFTKLASYLGREQYGDAPTWPRRYQTEDYFVQRYEERDENGNYIYGKWTAPGRKEVQKKDGNIISVPSWTKINTGAELKYLIKYQIYHMYVRYFLWNFVGRASDLQDAPYAFVSTRDAEALNANSGYASIFPIRFFALPLIFGFIGLFFHFKRNKRMAWVYLIMFLLLGVLATIQQNQQDPQPRERDYFYAGSFFVFCLWIGMGAYSLIVSLAKKNISTAIAAGVVAASFLLVPLNMALGGWKMHSRAGNYLPFDYSYNILQSLDKDAIVFTNGDNDTFPLWFLQDVMGVRRDVRIVNLSLGNTLWYVDQLKNREPWGAKKIPLSFADDSLHRDDETDPAALSYDFGEPREITIPVRREILAKYTNDPKALADGVFRFTWTGQPYQEVDGKMIHLFRVQDKVILDILQQTRFERPVYFSNTVGGDAFSGLEPFFRYEGMAMRICPVPQSVGGVERIDTEIMGKCLMNVDNSDNFSTTPKYGFKFRNLNNSNVYYDEVHRRLMQSYRQIFTVYAANLMTNKAANSGKAIAALDKMNELISTEQFPMNQESIFRVAQIYREAGAPEKTRKFADIGLKTISRVLNSPALRKEAIMMETVGRQYWGAHRLQAEFYKMKGDWNGALRSLQELYAATKSMRDQYAEQYPADGRRMEQSMIDILVAMDEIKIDEIAAKQGDRAAMAEATKVLERYWNSKDQLDNLKAQYFARKVSEISRRAGLPLPTMMQQGGDTVRQDGAQAPGQLQ
jgi:hypothetical protein